MAARREWTEWHLTPAGWVRGATRVHGRGNSWADDPEDRALSYVYQEVETSSSKDATVEETWRSKTAPVEQLLGLHGPCPRQL